MKKVLVVVDYQIDFVNGTLGFAGAEALEPKIVDKIEQYLKDGQDILFTYDTHSENYLDTKEGENLPVVHCVKGTPGYELYGAVAKYKEKAKEIFEKPTFGSLELAEFLREQQYNSVELVGLVSNICVLSNAVLAKAALPEADIVVDNNCTDAGDKEIHQKALDILKGVHVTVINE